MADTKVSALAAASVADPANELYINEAGTSKKLTVAQVVDYLYKRSAGTSMAAGPFETRLVLAANSSDITTTALTTVMELTNTGTGRFHFKCQLVYQGDTTFSPPGIDVAVNHTGTLTQFVVEHRFASTGTTDATAAPTEIAAGATGAIYVAQGSRTKNAIIGAGTVSVDTANLDMISTLEGFFVCSVDGNLQIKLATNGANGALTRARQGSFLELKKLS